MALIVWWPREIRTVEVSKAYFPQEGNIQIHQSRVKPCPPGFPSGYYWYGTRKKSAGRPPKVQNSANKSVLARPSKRWSRPKEVQGCRTPSKEAHSKEFEEEIFYQECEFNRDYVNNSGQA